MLMLLLVGQGWRREGWEPVKEGETAKPELATAIIPASWQPHISIWWRNTLYGVLLVTIHTILHTNASITSSHRVLGFNDPKHGLCLVPKPQRLHTQSRSVSLMLQYNHCQRDMFILRHYVGRVTLASHKPDSFLSSTMILVSWLFRLSGQIRGNTIFLFIAQDHGDASLLASGQ